MYRYMDSMQLYTYVAYSGDWGYIIRSSNNKTKQMYGVTMGEGY